MFNSSEFCRVLEEPDKDGVALLVIGAVRCTVTGGGRGKPEFSFGGISEGAFYLAARRKINRDPWKAVNYTCSFSVFARGLSSQHLSSAENSTDCFADPFLPTPALQIHFFQLLPCKSISSNSCLACFQA